MAGKFFLPSMIIIVCSLVLDISWGRTEKPVYAQSYRDYVYRNMSDNVRQLFYSVPLNPSCVQRKGQCIPRGKCLGKKMLYITRVCYKHDLVCCYEDYPPVDHPFVKVKDSLRTDDIANNTVYNTLPVGAANITQATTTGALKGLMTEPPSLNTTSTGSGVFRDWIATVMVSSEVNGGSTLNTQDKTRALIPTLPTIILNEKPGIVIVTTTEYGIDE